MAEIPWFPDYYVEVSNSDTESYMTNSSKVRLTFRVRDEELEGVINTLMPNTPIEVRKRLTHGR